ncbi:uncharacterized protein KD926_002156 [Aspergillus affinis]|uniref:uncharacterized protein n=1 Tax=Aspergillus affinis TaxID=1070780 RepID=UPI0022FE16A4|nr:uncharacterized protein KD926_002156 [Aspergillus affinis]KAI9036247.1 hypothetical protein KD926_002156 [Aspergillus affinis]
MIGKPPRTRNIARRISNTALINASSWDIKMHYHLLGLVSDKYTKLVLQAPVPFNPFQLDVKNTYLFDYFRCTASRSLTTFGHDPTSMGNLLIRMALANSSPSSAAVLRSLLALSSLHLHGLQGQAGELKLSALNALATASRTSIGPMETAQHVAAGMLLCSFEILRASCTSGQWRCYVGGVKMFINASCSGISDRDSDLNILLDWVYYHDVLSRFSGLHWRSEKDMDIPPPCSSEYPWRRAIPSTASSFGTTVQLLSEVCDIVAVRPLQTAPAEQLSQYIANAQILAWRINNIPEDENTINPKLPKMTELFQLSMLIYLSRATGNLFEPPYMTEQRIRHALAMLSDLNTCERQFPLFVIGCEARTDDERGKVLDLIDRTEDSTSSRSLFLVKELIKSIWVQDDLADREVDYMDKLTWCGLSRHALPWLVPREIDQSFYRCPSFVTGNLFFVLQDSE